MSNFVTPAGYPYGLKDPFPHVDLNLLVDQIVKAPNFTDGSTHAPSGDIVLSGANGHGFSFTVFPMHGTIDVTGGLSATASAPASVIFGTGVTTVTQGPLNAIGNASLSSVIAASWPTGSYAHLSGELLVEAAGPGKITVQDGALIDSYGATNFRGTSTQLYFSGSSISGVVSDSRFITRSGTTNIVAGQNINVAGGLLLKTSGPGVMTAEASTQIDIYGDMTLKSGGTLTLNSGSSTEQIDGADLTLRGDVDISATGEIKYASGSVASGIRTESCVTTLTGAIRCSGAGRVTYRAPVLLPDSNANIAIGSGDRFVVPGAQSADRIYSLTSTGAQVGDRIFISRPVADASFTASVSGQVVQNFSMAINASGWILYEWDGTNWLAVAWNTTYFGVDGLI